MRSADAADEFVFLPLGGAGEIGMNLNLYGFGPAGDPDWLMVDLGVAFGGDGIPGVDTLTPDPTYIAERRDRLLAIILTHAHEDHLGAVPYLWPALRCPVYATPFTGAVLRRKLAEVGLEAVVPVLPLRPGAPIEIGPFRIEAVGVTHSIPEAHALAITTPLGTIVHTGDWKLDPDPVVGAPSDEAALRRIGDAGVRALICDSTNVFEPGYSGSEAGLFESLRQVVADCPARAVVTCFATNVARLHTLARVAEATDRSLVMAGASIKRIYTAARECGYLGDVRAFIADEHSRDLPREHTLIVCTGGQGEPRAALSRLANGDHPHLSLEAEDRVIFSSRVIPGNEIAIGRLQNTLLRRGIRLITHRDANIHVSGHPARGELVEMYRLVRPDVLVPVHGELRHMLAQAELGRAHGIPRTIVVENGQIARLAPDAVNTGSRVPTGRLTVDGNRLLDLNSDLVRSRSRAIYNGSAFMTVVVNDSRKRVVDLTLSTIGLLNGEDDEVRDAIHGEVIEAIRSLPERQFEDDDVVCSAVERAIRRRFRLVLDKRPVTHVHLIRT